MVGKIDMMKEGATGGRFPAAEGILNRTLHAAIYGLPHPPFHPAGNGEA